MFKRIKEIIQPLYKTCPPIHLKPPFTISFENTDDNETCTIGKVTDSEVKNVAQHLQEQATNVFSALADKILSPLRELIPGISNEDNLLNLNDMRFINENIFGLQDTCNEDLPLCYEEPRPIIYDKTQLWQGTEINRQMKKSDIEMTKILTKNSELLLKGVEKVLTNSKIDTATVINNEEKNQRGSVNNEAIFFPMFTKALRACHEKEVNENTEMDVYTEIIKHYLNRRKKNHEHKEQDDKREWDVYTEFVKKYHDRRTKNNKLEYGDDKRGWDVYTDLVKKYHKRRSNNQNLQENKYIYKTENFSEEAIKAYALMNLKPNLIHITSSGTIYKQE